jgi:hypothetical protein
MSTTRPAELARPPASRLVHDSAMAAFAERAQAVGMVESDLVVGNERVRLAIAGTHVAQRLDQHLAWLEAPTTDQPAGTLVAFDAEGGGPRPTSPFQRRDFLVRDEVAGSGADGVQVAYGLESSLLSTVDVDGAVGTWWTPTVDTLPSWEITAPFRYQLHWLLAARAQAFVHAAAVGRDGVGLLLVGRGGAGKSTAAAACLAAGWDFLSDDYLCLTASPEPQAASIYGTAKLSPTSLAMMPDLADAVVAVRADDDKRVLDVARRGGTSLVRTLRLVGVVAPVISTSPGPAVPISSGTAVRELVASTMLQMASPAASTLRTVADVVASLPAFRVPVGPTAASIESAMATVLGDLVP